MCVGCWAGVTYFRYTMLKSPNKGEITVHCCDPALSILVMLVSQNVFLVVSSLHYRLSLYIFLLIKSLTDPTLSAFIVCGPLQFLVSQ